MLVVKNKEASLDRIERRPLLWITISTLPFAYIPHEIVASGPSFALISLGLIVASGAQYGAFRQKVGLVEVASILLMIWIISRLLVFGPLELDPQPPSWTQTASDVAPILGGVVLFRLGRTRALRPTILSGLLAAVVGMLVVEGYQLAVGVGHLMSLGYVTPLFNYYTESGAFRPFSTFLSPTVFGGYLAMVGIAVVILSPARWRPVLSIGVLAGLALTYTRASWIAFSSAVIVAIMHLPSRIKGLLAVVAVPLSLLGALAVLAFPSLFSGLLARLDTVSDSSFSSNTIRVDLWEGVLNAVAVQPVVGYGARPFSIVMEQYVGSYATLAHSHNNYLQQMFLYGIPGLMLLVMLLISFSISLRDGAAHERLWVIAGRAALAVFAVDSFFEATWGSFNVAATLFLLVGLGSTLPNYGMEKESYRNVEEPNETKLLLARGRASFGSLGVDRKSSHRA